MKILGFRWDNARLRPVRVVRLDSEDTVKESSEHGKKWLLFMAFFVQFVKFVFYF